MAWLADAHREWHYVHGANTVCPLDCGVGEDMDQWDEESYAEWKAEEAEAQQAFITRQA